MAKRRANWVAFAALAWVTVVGCADETQTETSCGPGTILQGTQCLPQSSAGASGQGTAGMSSGGAGLQCGPGTKVQGNQCVPEVAPGGAAGASGGSPSVTCGPGTKQENNQCVPEGIGGQAGGNQAGSPAAGMSGTSGQSGSGAGGDVAGGGTAGEGGASNAGTGGFAGTSDAGEGGMAGSGDGGNDQAGSAGTNQAGEGGQGGEAGSATGGGGQGGSLSDAFGPLTRQIAIGLSHVCAIVKGGKVRCWGSNFSGQLGYATNPTGGPKGLPTDGDVDVGGPVIQLSAGDEHTCALLEGGTVRCWGRNSDGRLGYAHLKNIGDDETPASAGDVDIGGKVIQIAAGYTHTCALLEGGNVRCWGGGGPGQLGYGNSNSIGDDETPSMAGDVKVGGKVIQIAAGNAFTCALLEGGSVRCWGDGFYGQLGYGNTTTIGDNEAPLTAGDVFVGEAVVSLTAGMNHTCALLESKNLRCWGQNGYGQLGYGNTTKIGDNELPAQAGNVSVGEDVLQVDAGDTRTCALLQGGGVRCWGEAKYLGYVNNNNIGDNEFPSAVGEVQLGGKVRRLAVGALKTCALMMDGTVRCWGSGYPQGAVPASYDAVTIGAPVEE